MQKHTNVLAVILAAVIVATLFATCGVSPAPDAPHWPDCATGEGNIFNAHAIVNIEAPTDLIAGDIIGIFDAAGDCVGQSLYQGAGAFAVTIWADDPQTPEKDGFVEGSAFGLRIFGERPVNVAANRELLALTDASYIISGITFQDGSVIGDLQTQIAALQADLAIRDQQLATVEADLIEANTKLVDIQGVLDR